MSSSISSRVARIYRCSVVDSTNDQARRMLEQGVLEVPACIIAEEQTAGKGTHGRVWVSPRGAGLYMSYVYKPDSAHVPAATMYTQAAGIGCVEALNRYTDSSVYIKPINDLMAQGRKLGGILTEAHVEENRFTSLITGVGINLYKCPLNLPRTGVLPISLEEITSKERIGEINIEKLAADIVTRLQFWYGVVLAGDTQQVERLWRDYQMTGA